MQDLTIDRAGRKALGEAARAFARAQKLGYAWVGEQGTFETCEGWCEPPEPKRPSNPAQMELSA